MRCPFCRKSIEDDALVCHHCGRELTFVRPLIERVEALEKRLSAPPRESAAPAGRPGGVALLVLVGALCLLATATTFWAAFTPWPDLYKVPFYLVGLAPPLLFGVLAGVRLTAWGPLRLFNAGLVLGVFDLAAALAILGNVPGVELNWPWILVVFVIGQPVIVASAGWLVERLTAEPLTFAQVKTLLRDTHFLLGLLAQIAGQIVSFQSLKQLF
jgi:hypothetical protein